jgi:hypothetical protein
MIGQRIAASSGVSDIVKEDVQIGAGWTERRDGQDQPSVP